jgi:hypothetical protein
VKVRVREPDRRSAFKIFSRLFFSSSSDEDVESEDEREKKDQLKVGIFFVKRYRNQRTRAAFSPKFIEE